MRKTETLLLFSLIALLFLTVVAAYSFSVSADGNGTGGNALNNQSDANITNNLQTSITTTQDCQNITINTEQTVDTQCVTPVTTCSDAPINSSCTTINQTNACSYTRVVPIQQTVCTTTSYTFFNKYKITPTGYKCTPTDNGTNDILECDSSYDGNGDGICQSGESCIKYVATISGVDSYQKNSNADYVSSDESFFLAQPMPEVLQ